VQPKGKKDVAMKAKTGYLVLCVLGTVLPLSQLLPFVREHGFDGRLMIDQLFSTRMGAFFALDVLVSAITLVVLIRKEGRRVGLRHAWLPILATVCIGVSLGLPLFLYMRENQS
jgi:hypothetical protein